MRTFLIFLTLILLLSGLLIKWFPVADEQYLNWTILVHTWLGLFFFVIFPMYTLDHLRTHQKRLKIINALWLSGLSQLTTGSIIIVTGVMLLAFPGRSLPSLNFLHLVVSIILLFAYMCHFLSPKN